MVFEDLFYPDNPRKRREVANYQAKFRRSFKDFKGSWNDLCTSFNDVVRNAKPDWILQLLAYDPDSHDPKYMLDEIKKVMEDTKSKVPKIESDIGINDIARAFEEIDPEKIKNISKAIELILGALSSAILIPVFMVIFSYLDPILGAIGAGITGIVGGVFAFVLLGITLVAIIDAIAGAMEKKTLEDAIAEFKKFDRDCIVPLDNARRRIDGINQNIKDGVYKIDEHHIIMNGRLIEV